MRTRRSPSSNCIVTSGQLLPDVDMPGSMERLKLAHYVRGRCYPVDLIITSGQPKPMLEDMPAGSGSRSPSLIELAKVANNMLAMIG